MGVFDDMPAEFIGAFGELVVYTPNATGIPATISAIWIEHPVAAIKGEVDTDATEATLHVPAATVVPVEGDTAQRVKTGNIMRVVTPIRPDGQGMIAAALEEIG